MKDTKKNYLQQEIDEQSSNLGLFAQENANADSAYYNAEGSADDMADGVYGSAENDFIEFDDSDIVSPVESKFTRAPRKRASQGRRAMKDSKTAVSATKAKSAASSNKSASNEDADHSKKSGANENNAQNTPQNNSQNTPQNNGGLDKKSGSQKKRSGGNDANRNNQGASKKAEAPTKDELVSLKVVDLRALAATLEIDFTGLKKADLIESILAVIKEANKPEPLATLEGILDIMSEGFGFIRANGYLPSEKDAYVGQTVIRRNGLRKGDKVCAELREKRDSDKYPAVQCITSVNGKETDGQTKRIKFASLTPVYPDERLIMEYEKNAITARVIDLVAPIGKGQRGLIVSPPKAGKTTILKDIAASISKNNPEVYLMCLLVDERPEEVTDMERSINGEVISSTFDMPSENHIAVSELVIERAKRLVEEGRDVVILLDSITRLARAYNLAQPASGRVLSGGVDSTALYPPKRFLGAARNIEDGGSLTILASALIETGSKMDEVIFEEFKGTGNMELKLDRSLADRRIFPAIDPISSGTRKEELLMDPQVAPLIWAVRSVLSGVNSTERAMDMLIKSLRQTENNEEFLIRTARKAQQGNKSSDKAEL